MDKTKTVKVAKTEKVSRQSKHLATIRELKANIVDLKASRKHYIESSNDAWKICADFDAQLSHTRFLAFLAATLGIIESVIIILAFTHK